jgi:uncharacterized iron-regulated protein
MRTRLSIAIALATCACAPQLTLAPKGGFAQPLGKEHALVGRVYATAGQRLVPVSELEGAIERARFVVLGESHDNRDHHALEAELGDRFLKVHEPAAAGFEMLDEDDRAALQSPPRDPDALARAVRWGESGWPEFEQYRPVFEVVLAHGAELIAAHPSREHVRASMSGVPEAEARALRLDPPLSTAARKQLEQEIRVAHCGYAPDTMLEAMVRAQTYKDAFMARSIFAAGKPVVLVTGRGHARTDRAVPYYLRRLGASSVLSVAFIEVDDANQTPEAYEVAPYDFVIFTPRATDEDPCEQFKRQLKKLG